MRQLRLAAVYAADSANRTLSYQHGWPAELARSRRFDVVAFNVARRADRLALRTRRHLIDSVDAVVLLHSVFSNELALSDELVTAVARARPPKVFFIGNEYKLMPEKMAFAEAIGTRLLVSQLLSPDAHRLYAERLGCEVVGIPNTGFDPALFRPQIPWRERPVDIGYRAFASPLYLGHDERKQLAEAVTEAAATRGYVIDISLDPAHRLDVAGWAAFLNRCKAQLGTEAGGDYFELTDETRRRVNVYLSEHPDAGISEIRGRFFAGRPPSSAGRTISGRIVEAAATKTVQVLLEGAYGGFFEPWTHYVPVRRDLADLDAALDALRDVVACSAIAERAFGVAHSELTYDRLLERFADALALVVT